MTTALFVVVTAGCGGSALSPQQVLAANQAVLGVQGQAAAQVGNGGAPGPSSISGTGSGVQTPGSTGRSRVTGGNAPAAGGVTGAPSGPVAGAGITAASCAGFKNQTGITSSTINIGNASDVSGPIPGLFASSQLATRAYVAYFNATHPGGLCGRRLALDSLDTRTDAGSDQQAYTKMCEQDFAAVGSMSGFDSGGAAAAQSCGIPDIRSTSVTGARNQCSTCFSAQATGDHEYENEAFDFYVQHYPSAVTKAALLYINAGAAEENALVIQSVAKKRGYNFLYVSAIDVADFNYGPYVQQMKSKGVQYVQFVGAAQNQVRLAQAMQDNAFKPQVLAFDASAYDSAIQQAGSAVDGAFLFVDFTPLDQNQAELNRYRQWLTQVSPGAKPTFLGLFSWSAAKLFVEKALALGGKLDRASLVASIRTVRSWTGGGLHAPMDVGSKHPPSCLRFMQIKNGNYVPVGGTTYICRGYSKG